MRQIWVLCLLFAANLALAEGQEPELYHDSCALCHDDGSYNAPKVGDKTAWAPLIKKGKKALYKSIINGKGEWMPPHDKLEIHPADAELKAVLNWMIARSR